MEIRIGINLVDIIERDDRIDGDGVNIAAGIENPADTGDIRISRVVNEQFEGRLDVGFADRGTHAVKNIKKPINIYKVRIDPKDAGKNVEATQLTRSVESEFLSGAAHRKPYLP